MKPRLMQRIDFWLGIPGCAAVSLWKRLLRHRPCDSPPRKVLFIELSEMGSAILAHSSISLTRRALPGAELYFLIFKSNQESASLLALFPEANIITIDSSSLCRFALSTVRALMQCRRAAIDTTLDLELFSRFTALFAYLTGAERRVGFDNYNAEGLYRGRLLTHPVLYNPHQHIALNFLALSQAISADTNDLPLLKQKVTGLLLGPPVFAPARQHVLAFSEELKARVHVPPGAEFVAVNPDPGMLALRGWPIEHYVQLCNSLIAEQPSVFIILTGSPEQRSTASQIAKELPPERTIDMTGKTGSLHDLLALLSLCKVFITSDSGPAHMAALIRIPRIVLFGPETSLLYGPMGEHAQAVSSGLACSPCYSAYNHRSSPCRNNVCMKAIQPADVQKLVENFLIRGRSEDVQDSV